MKTPGGQLPESLRVALDSTHSRLLVIHKALLDHERTRYERTRGAIFDAGALLQLVIDDPWFGWLKPLSALIAQIDEVTADDEPFASDRAQALLTESQRLLAPRENGTQFQREYLRAIQESPDVAYLHGQWKKGSPVVNSR